MIRERRPAFAGGAGALVLAGFLSWLPASPATADVYKYVDKYGRVYLTDKPDHGGYKLLVKTWKGWAERKGPRLRLNVEENRKRYAEHITDAAKRYGLSTSLLHAVITAESWYDPDAVSSAGAVGLMQLMPATAERYGVRDRTDPVSNIDGGSRYLRDLLAMFKNDLKLAVAAYNAGENAVIRNGHQIPPYAETQDYVRKVLDYYRQYLAAEQKPRKQAANGT
jgi:soluble lytic murein transglycosylase-like protein